MIDLDLIAQQLLTKTVNRPSSGNQRAYADAIEELGCELAQQQWPSQYVPARSVRSPEDFMIVNGDHSTYVDIKTRQIGTDFNMPNLISVDRLQKLLDDTNCDLVYWIIDYSVDQQGNAPILTSHMVPVYHLNWQGLSIGNLGLGQLQITNWNNLVQPTQNRDEWTQRLRSVRRDFYTSQAQKFQRLAESLG
jgi:hypothetical protein